MNNSIEQRKVLNKLIIDQFGKEKIKPMLVIDNESLLRNDDNMSARKAAITGFE